MTRPPRPKYPSDSKNYHDLRRPGFAHTVRLPEELLDTYTNLKKALGPKSSHADVLRFVFEATESAISAVLQAVEPLVAPDSQVNVEDDLPADAYMDVMQDPGHESASEVSEDDLGGGKFPVMSALEAWEEQKKRLHQELVQAGKPLVVYVDCRFDSSRSGFHGTLPLPEAGASSEIARTRPLRYPELAQHDLAYKVKTWVYTCAKNAAVRGDSDPKVLTLDIQNAADHWAGLHIVCGTLPGTRKCVIAQTNPAKYAEVRCRARTNKVLVRRTSVWKHNLARKVFG
ncbi:hypothetical protein R1sor_006527 [Riccia sorocarpa]|uniref:Uncharacterized protein n=1 Tax=Riccia sorocarpa TaxID=122646 RepID=A0ABD3HRX5_9MARC